MNIAVLSGKGGTGKTTVSTNLALAMKSNYIDCDVEEPNGFLFLNPDIERKENVMVEYPVIDKDKCTNCKACVESCQFNALAHTNGEIILFEKMCHGCGTCQIVCKAKAIKYEERSIGQIEEGKTNSILCSRGILDIGETMAVPVIRQLLQEKKGSDNLVDCSPGTSCNVVNSLKYVEAAILVTEPSYFGLHDLKMAVKLVKDMNIPFGIIINKDNGEENIVKKYCKEENIKIIGLIPYQRNVAVEYSKGHVLYHNETYKKIFDELTHSVREVFSQWN